MVKSFLFLLTAICIALFFYADYSENKSYRNFSFSSQHEEADNIIFRSYWDQVIREALYGESREDRTAHLREYRSKVAQKLQEDILYAIPMGSDVDAIRALFEKQPLTSNFIWRSKDNNPNCFPHLYGNKNFIRCDYYISINLLNMIFYSIRGLNPKFLTFYLFRPGFILNVELDEDDKVLAYRTRMFIKDPI